MPDPDFYLHYLEMASISHAWSTIFLGLLWIWDAGYEFDHQTTYYEYLCIANSLGYFIEDSIMEVLYSTGDAGIYAHHAFSIILATSTIMYSYGGMTMVAGLFFGEITNPFFWYRNYLRRKGYEFTTEYQVWFWFYGLFYYFWRGIMYSYNNYYTVISMTIPFSLKWMFLPIIFISHGWMFMLSRALWKNLPYWYSNPKEIEETEWWNRGRIFLKKYTKDAPWVYIVCIFISIYSCIIPISYSYYLHSIHQQNLKSGTM